MGLVGNCSLRAHSDARGGLDLPWGGSGIDASLVVRISAQDAGNLSSGWLEDSPIQRTKVTTPSGECEWLDFAPRFQDHGEIHRPPVLVRIARPLSGRVLLIGSFEARGWTVVATGNGVEFHSHGPDRVVRLVGPLAEQAARGMPFELVEPSAWIASEGPLASWLAGPVTAVAEEVLARTRAEWRRYVLGLRLPLEPQQSVVHCALRIKLAEDEAVGGFTEDVDATALVEALDALGCIEELRRFARRADRPVALVRALLDRRISESSRSNTDVTRWTIVETPPASTKAALWAWGDMRATHLVAMHLRNLVVAERAREAMQILRAHVERHCFDERRGLLRAGVDDQGLDPQTLCAITLGFFAPNEPRARALVAALADLTNHDAGAKPRSRAELAHALALVGRVADAREVLAALVAEGLGHGALADATAFVRAAFVCSRKWP